jgi:hypothetical protein
VPDDLVRALRALASDEPGRNRGDRDRLVTAELKPFLRTMLLTVGWRLDGDEMHIGLTVGPIGLPHTTVNPSTERHVGLHFDSWDRLGPLDRDRGTNRLCVNLGIGARHLLFVPKAAAVVLQEFASKHLDVFTPEALQDSTGRFDLARRYLEAFPEQPVLRIRVLPGEAYVAPTENLIHDGSSEESIDRDISVTVRGFFVPLEARATV